jgi:hypothetical protein
MYAGAVHICLGLFISTTDQTCSIPADYQKNQLVASPQSPSVCRHPRDTRLQSFCWSPMHVLHVSLSLLSHCAIHFVIKLSQANHTNVGHSAYAHCLLQPPSQLQQKTLHAPGVLPQQP